MLLERRLIDVIVAKVYYCWKDIIVNIFTEVVIEQVLYH